jgi:hypothetical protein
MTNVTRIRHALPVSAEITQAVNDFAVGLGQAINAAKEAGVPQGFVVSMLHGVAQEQARLMMELNDEGS